VHHSYARIYFFPIFSRFGLLSGFPCYKQHNPVRTEGNDTEAGKPET